MKAIKPKLLFWLIIVLLAVIVVPIGVGYLMHAESKGNTVNYSTKELTNNAVSDWIPTNTIPLSPDKAVIAAINFANSERSKLVLWDVNSVEIRKLSPETSWFYTVILIDRTSGRYDLAVVRILMNGKVWKPNGNK